MRATPISTTAANRRHFSSLGAEEHAHFAAAENLIALNEIVGIAMSDGDTDSVADDCVLLGQPILHAPAEEQADSVSFQAIVPHDRPLRSRTGMDAKLGSVPWFAEFGQDWTLLGSSTQYDIFETTGNGVGFGNFYERLPQFKTGLQFTAGKLKIEPEFAELVDLKFFCGFSFAEIAALQKLSERTVQRRWERARIYLRCWISGMAL